MRPNFHFEEIQPSFPRIVLDSPKAGADPVTTIFTTGRRIVRSVAEVSGRHNSPLTEPDQDRARVSYRRIESVPGQAPASCQRATCGRVKVRRSFRPIELGPHKALRNSRPTKIG